MSASVHVLRMRANLLGLVSIFLAFGFAPPVRAQVAQIAHFVSPIYPPLARQAMISGQVTLRADLAEDGTITSILEESSAHPLLAQHAKACVGEWKFQAGTHERRVSVVLYYGFSGTIRESNPVTTVKADFAGSTVRVYITTDPVPTVHP